MKNNNTISIMLIVTYINAYKDKYIIYQENHNKCGIHRLNNIISGKTLTSLLITDHIITVVNK